MILGMTFAEIWAMRAVRIAVAAIAAIALLAVAKCSYDRRIIAAHDAGIDAQSNTLSTANATAAAVADADRRADTAQVAQNQKEQHDAIAAAPDSSPGPARVALNCQRLRATGRREDALPAACRPEGRGEAGAD